MALVIRSRGAAVSQAMEVVVRSMVSKAHGAAAERAGKIIGGRGRVWGAAKGKAQVPKLSS